MPEKPVRCGVPLHIYNAWYHMNHRCYVEKDEFFKHYGGRGIRVCDRWRTSLQNFFEDMGDRPRGMTLERLDVNGHYCPENCVWASWTDQARNRRNNHNITYAGVTKTIREWAIDHGVTEASIRARVLLHGVDRALRPDFHETVKGTTKRPRGKSTPETLQRNKSSVVRKSLAYKRTASSRFLGVSKATNDGFAAYVKKGGVFVFRKWFKSELTAALARDQAAREHHGDGARLNFPERFAEARVRELA